MEPIFETKEHTFSFIQNESINSISDEIYAIFENITKVNISIVSKNYVDCNNSYDTQGNFTVHYYGTNFVIRNVLIIHKGAYYRDDFYTYNVKIIITLNLLDKCNVTNIKKSFNNIYSGYKYYIQNLLDTHNNEIYDYIKEEELESLVDRYS